MFYVKSDGLITIFFLRFIFNGYANDQFSVQFKVFLLHLSKFY